MTITNVGVVTVKFNEEILVPQNYSSFNESIINVKMHVGSDSNADDLIFTWIIISFSSQEMKL